VEVDKPFTIKPGTLLSTTSITYNVQQVTRQKNVESCSSFGFTGLYKQGLPKYQSLLKISISREQHYADRTKSIFVVTPCMLSTYSIIIPTTAHIYNLHIKTLKRSDMFRS